MNRRIKGLLICIMFCLMVGWVAKPITAYAVPAPGLKSISIVGLDYDENNEINVKVVIVGTPRNIFCWYENSLCQKNNNSGYYLFRPGSNIAYGEVVYFKTGMYYTPDNYNKTVDVRCQATNANRPWNTLSTSGSFTIKPKANGDPGASSLW